MNPNANLSKRKWFFVASHVVTDKKKPTKRDVDNDIPYYLV